MCREVPNLRAHVPRHGQEHAGPERLAVPPPQDLQGGRPGGFIANARLVLHLGMLARGDETDILLINVITRHADERARYGVGPLSFGVRRREEGTFTCLSIASQRSKTSPSAGS